MSMKDNGMTAAARMEDKDRELADMHCAYRGLSYLSHERYGDELWIAVEAPGERFELKINEPRGLSATERASREAVNPNPSQEAG